MRRRSLVADPWCRITVDVAATRRLYAALDRPASDGCRCAECREYAAGRNVALPAAFRSLLERMGIAWENESELWAVRGRDGLYVNAQFDFIGEVSVSHRIAAADGQVQFFFAAAASERCAVTAAACGLGTVSSIRLEAIVPAELLSA